MRRVTIVDLYVHRKDDQKRFQCPMIDDIVKKKTRGRPAAIQRLYNPPNKESILNS